jgi:hypothetical protein
MNNLTLLRRLMAVDDRKKELTPPPPAYAVDTDSKFIWTTGADVMKTFRRHGFVPPSEVRNDYLFKKNRELKDE